MIREEYQINVKQPPRNSTSACQLLSDSNCFIQVNILNRV